MSNVTDTCADLDANSDRGEREARRGQLLRRVVVVILLLFVGLGLSGRLGYRQASQQVDGERFDIEFSYPSVTRGGLPTRWSVQITTVDTQAFGDTLRIETSASYLDGFDHNDLVPAPDRTWQTPDTVTWEYDAAEETSLMVTLDVRTQPDHRWRSSSTTVVYVGDSEVARFDYHTWTLP